MTEFLHKKNVLYLLLMSLCMFTPLKSAYAVCDGGSECTWQLCTTEAEARDWLTGCPPLAPIPWLPGSNCYWITCGSNPSMPHPCLLMDGVNVQGSICWTCPGAGWCPPPAVKVVPQCSAGDYCCLKPDDPCCQVAGSTGSGSNVTNAVSGH